MAPTLVQRGSIRGPQGLQGVQGPKGDPGRTLDPEGSEPTKASLAARTGMVVGQAWIVVENGCLYVYEGAQASQSGQPGYDAALPGFTNMGKVQGPQGDQGPQGLQGVKGDTGAQGIQGVKGDTGQTGQTGAKGDQGIQGAQGIQGVKGDTGAAGTPGAKGDTGAQGVQGIQGPAGTAGSRMYPYNGSTGRTLAQVQAVAKVGDQVVDLDTGAYYEVIDA